VHSQFNRREAADDNPDGVTLWTGYYVEHGPQGAMSSVMQKSRGLLTWEH
jgi:hypothetical protein